MHSHFLKLVSSEENLRCLLTHGSEAGDSVRHSRISSDSFCGPSQLCQDLSCESLQGNSTHAQSGTTEGEGTSNVQRVFPNQRWQTRNKSGILPDDLLQEFSLFFYWVQSHVHKVPFKCLTHFIQAKQTPTACKRSSDSKVKTPT